MTFNAERAIGIDVHLVAGPVTPRGPRTPRYVNVFTQRAVHVGTEPSLNIVVVAARGGNHIIKRPETGMGLWARGPIVDRKRGTFGCPPHGEIKSVALPRFNESTKNQGDRTGIVIRLPNAPQMRVVTSQTRCWRWSRYRRTTFCRWRWIWR